jgi:hypothetical protein
MSSFVPRSSPDTPLPSLVVLGPGIAAVAVVGGAVDAASFFFLVLLLRVFLDTMQESEAACMVVIIAALLGLLCVFLPFPSVAYSGGLFCCWTVLARAGVAGLVLLDVGLVRVASARGVRSNLRLGPLRRKSVVAGASISVGAFDRRHWFRNLVGLECRSWLSSTLVRRLKALLQVTWLLKLGLLCVIQCQCPS